MFVGERLGLPLGEAALRQPLDEAVRVECDGRRHGWNITSPAARGKRRGGSLEPSAGAPTRKTGRPEAARKSVPLREQIRS